MLTKTNQSGLEPKSYQENTLRMTYVFKLYNASRNHRIHTTINVSGEIWNYCIAYLRAYYKVHKKLPSKYDLQKHLTRVKKQEEFNHWNEVGSQAIQDITDRIYRSYDQFFRLRSKGKKASPPSFKKIWKYKSYTLKQAGYKLLDGNKIKIGKKVYKYHKSREVLGKINTVTVKRDALGDIYLYITCTVENAQAKKLVTSGKIVGIDFGMKTFLTLSDGTRYEAPLFYTQGLPKLRKASREFSTKTKGSNREMKAYLYFYRTHKKVKNKRHDYFHKLARKLTKKYNVICIEDLNIAAMKKIWGRKISDLAFSEFVAILKHHCNKSGTTLVVIDRYFPSSKQCYDCLVINENLSLNDREWTCGNCHATHDRDLNAAKNIARAGASALGLGEIRPTSLATTA